VLVFIPLTLATSTDINLWYLIIPVALFLIIVIGGSILAVFLVIGGRKRRLDQALIPLGLTGRAYSLTMRQYSGSYREREVEVFMRRSPALEFEVGTSLQTRLGITTADTLAQSFRELVAQQPETPQNPALQELRYYPLDPAWSQQAVNDPSVAQALRRLLFAQTVFERTEVTLSPGKLRLFVFGNPSLFSVPLTPGQAHEWLEALIDLLNALEALPAPQVNAAPSELEKTAASFRKVNWVLVTFATLAVLVIGIIGGGVGLAALLIWLNP
jgi:hypothetical protein